MSNTTVENSGIVVREANDEELETWNDFVERSPQGNMFLYREALQVQADHANVDLHYLLGYKGQEPIGVFPLFVEQKGWLTKVYSAGPGLWVSYLGPALLNFQGLKRRKRERRHKRFVSACLEWIDREFDPDYVQVRPDTAYTDVRPFQWQGFDIEIRHTYVVDLTPTEEELLMSFSSDARRNIRTDGDYRIYEGGSDEIESIVSQVSARYDEQDERFDVGPGFGIALYDHLPDGAVRPYTLEIEGDFAGGILALEFDDTVYRWMGGAKHDHDIPINDLLDWSIITDGMDRGLRRYDLVGANEERLCSYKAKFGPELQQYFRMEKRTLAINLYSGMVEGKSRLLEMGG